MNEQRARQLDDFSNFRGCASKFRFVSRRVAEMRAAENAAVRLFVYKCPDCKGFHLTKSPPRLTPA